MLIAHWNPQDKHVVNIELPSVHTDTPDTTRDVFMKKMFIYSVLLMYSLRLR